MSSVCIEKNDNYEVSYELVEGELIFMHISVESFSKTVLKEIKSLFEGLMRVASEQGYYYLFAQTPNLRFVKALGQPYEVFGTTEVDGEKQWGVSWELKY